MIHSVFNDNFIKYKKKTIAKALVSAALIVIFAVSTTLMAIYSGDNLKIQISALLAAALFEIAFIFFFVVMIQRGHLKRITRLAGENLCWQIDKQGISLKDTVEGRIIEKAYSWNDIKYVHMQCYTKQPVYGGYFYGLLFVMDADKFHTALAQRRKKPDFYQRDEELDGGFFIVCEMEYFKTVESLWGKIIR